MTMMEPAMDLEQFWALIAQSRQDAAGNLSAQEKALAKLLAELEPDELVDFDKHYHDMLDVAYRWDLWAAAYILNGGCSDDGFDYFRDWLIAQGETVFVAALQNPESLCAVAVPYACEAETFRYIVGEVYEEKFDAALPFALRDPAPLQGEEWDEDTVETLYPKLAALVAAV